MSISVKSESLRRCESEYKKLSQKLSQIENSLQTIRKSLDSDIKYERNIDNDFKKVCEDVDQNERSLTDIAKFLSDTVEAYESAEKNIKKDLTKISQKKSGRNIFSDIFDKLGSIRKKAEAILKILIGFGIFGAPIGTIIALNEIKKYFDEKGVVVNNKEVKPIEIKKADIPELNGILSYDPSKYKEEVLLLQKKLNELGYTDDKGRKLVEDGLFGSNTLAAVNKYKEQNGLWNFGEYKGKVGNTTWLHLFTNDKVVKVPKSEEHNGKNSSTSAGEFRDSAGNPSYQEIVNYITDQCNAIGLPVEIGLAIAWTESGMTQFGEKDNAKKCINKNKKGEITSTDWGLMQLNDKSWGSEYDFERIKSDWKYNVQCGLKVALNRYNKAVQLNEPDIARATYSGYNTWSNIDRYRTENDKRDENFWKNYTSKPWEKYVDTEIDTNKPSEVETTENELIGYSQGSEEERIEYIFGEGTKLWEDFYQTENEAVKHMKTVEVKVWKYDEKSGTKVPSTKSITVNEKLADVIVKIFDEIYNDPEQFPIDWDTGAYNWRGDGSKSMHNQGLAIDINWEENAEMTNSGQITAGKLYEPGENMYSIPKGSSVVRAFKKYGWYWGGEWNSKKDYMHFAYLNR